MGFSDFDQDQDGAVLDDVGRNLATYVPAIMGKGVGLIGGPEGQMAGQALGVLGGIATPERAEWMGDFWSDLAGTRGAAGPGCTDPSYQTPEAAAQTTGSELRGMVGETPASLMSAGVGAFSGAMLGSALTLDGAGLVTGPLGIMAGGAGGGLLGGAGGAVLGGAGAGLAGAAGGALTGAALGAALGPIGMLGGGLMGGLSGGLGMGLGGAAMGGALGGTTGSTLGALGGGVLGTAALPIAGAAAGAYPAMSSLFGHFAE